MKAVIMAGGFGTRLRPLTCNIPKPMVPMINKPMMQHTVELLRNHLITDVVTTLFYQPETITRYFGDGSAFNVHIQYVKAEADYGTAGSVRNAASSLSGLNERFLIISGDVLTDFNLTKALEFHKQRKAKVTILLSHSKNPLQYGVVITRDDGRIIRFLEKPSWGEVFSDTINTGIYIIEPEVLELIPYQEEFDFSKDLFPMLLELHTVSGTGLFGYIAEGYWRDIGNLNEYQEAHWDCLAGNVRIEVAGKKTGTVYVGEDTVIKTKKTNLEGRNLIGKNCTVLEDVKISNSVIGDHCTIEPGAIIRNSVIWDNVVIHSGVELINDVVGSHCTVGDHTVIFENVFIGDHCTIGKKARLASNIKLWPEKLVEDGAVLTRSLVCEDKWLRELFTDSRVTGLSNIEMNPEFGAKLGAAFGAFVGAGKTVVTSRDADNVSRMINRALMCGLVSAGVNVNDLHATSIPIVRYELSSGKEVGGIHVRKSPYGKKLTDIIFFDNNGKDLPVNKSKTVERLFFGEDFPRAPYDKVGSIFFSERTAESYREKFLSCLNIEAINKAKWKVVIDYSNGIVSTIFPNILSSLNCQVIALNAYVDPQKLTREKDELDRSLRQLSHIVTSLKYDLGCMFDAGGEKVFFVDEHGKSIDSDRLLALVTKLFLEVNRHGKKIAVPITASGEVDLIGREYGVEVVKTKNSHLAMMNAIEDKDILFVGGTKGGFIFREFLCGVDAMFAFAKILELMALTNKRLGEVEKTTPRLSMIRREVHCPRDAKGKVMRYIIKHTERFKREVVDGVKIYFDAQESYSSVLLLPDKEQPIFHITAEAKEKSIASKLAEEYEQKIIAWGDGHSDRQRVS